MCFNIILILRSSCDVTARAFMEVARVERGPPAATVTLRPYWGSVSSSGRLAFSRHVSIDRREGASSGRSGSFSSAWRLSPAAKSRDRSEKRPEIGAPRLESVAAGRRAFFKSKLDSVRDPSPQSVETFKTATNPTSPRRSNSCCNGWQINCRVGFSLEPQRWKFPEAQIHLFLTIQ